MLLYRLRAEVGDRLVDRALAGDARALDRLERLAWSPRKRPGLIKLVERLRGEYDQTN